MRRRTFVRLLTATGCACAFPHHSNLRARPAPASNKDAGIEELIEAHRPSRLKQLPRDFPSRVGATHVAGKYHLSREPFLLDGAKKLLELGTRLGKFWFNPHSIARSYRFNSRWEQCQTFVELAESAYFRQLFDLPFSTIIHTIDSLHAEHPGSNRS